jgi:hypothetical protein
MHAVLGGTFLQVTGEGAQAAVIRTHPRGTHVTVGKQNHGKILFTKIQNADLHKIQNGVTKSSITSRPYT